MGRNEKREQHDDLHGSCAAADEQVKNQLSAAQIRLSEAQLVGLIASPLAKEAISRRAQEVDEMRTCIMLDVVKLLVQGGHAFIYGGFVRDCIVGLCPNDLDFGIRDDYTIEEALNIVNEYAEKNNLSFALQQNREGFARVKLYAGENTMKDSKVHDGSLCSTEALCSKLSIRIDFTRFAGFKPWVDCDVNNLKIENMGSSNSVDIKVDVRIKTLDCKFWKNGAFHSSVIPNHSFEVSSILQNLKERRFDLFVSVRKSALISKRALILAAKGFECRNIYSELPRNNFQGNPECSDSDLAAYEESSSNLPTSSALHLFSEDLQHRESLPFAVLLKNSVFQGTLKRIGTFAEVGNFDKWTDLNDREIQGRYNGPYPLECMVKQKDLSYFAIYNGQQLPWQQLTPQKIHILNSAVFIQDLACDQTTDLSSHQHNPCHDLLVKRYCDQRLKIEFEKQIFQQQNDLQERSGQIKELENRIEQLKKEKEQLQDEVPFVPFSPDNRSSLDRRRNVSAAAPRESEQDYTDERKESSQDPTCIKLSDARQLKVIHEDEAKRFVSNIGNQWARLAGMLREALCKCLEHLGPGLYQSKKHFLAELIQNADDCSYSPEQTPTLKLIFNQNEILLVKNEIGFSAADVYSVCSIGQSTKRKGSGQIGHKGLGFKAVFAVSDSPAVLSPPWFFKFTKGGDEVESCITPKWLDKARLPREIQKVQEELKCGSVLYLPYNQAMKAKFLENHFEMIDPPTLLFLNKLKKVEVIQNVDPTAQYTICCEKIQDIDYSGESHESWAAVPKCSEYEIMSDSTIQVLVTRASVYVPKKYCSELETGCTEIAVCFPKDQNSVSEFAQGFSVYACLPVQRLGFPFKIQAGWDLCTSRESVNEDTPLNSFLRGECADLVAKCLTSGLFEDFVDLIPELNPSLGSWWKEFVHRVHDAVKDKVVSRYAGLQIDSSTQLVTCGSQSEALFAIISKDDLKKYGGLRILEHENYQTQFVEAVKKIPSLSMEFEELNVFHLLSAIPSRENNNRYTIDNIVKSWDGLFKYMADSSRFGRQLKIEDKALFLALRDDLEFQRGCISPTLTYIVHPQHMYLISAMQRMLKHQAINLVGYQSKSELKILEKVFFGRILDISIAVSKICAFHCNYHVLVKSIHEQNHAESMWYDHLDALVTELVLLFKHRDDAEREIDDCNLGYFKPLWIPIESSPFSTGQHDLSGMKYTIPAIRSPQSEELVRIASASQGIPVVMQTVLGVKCPLMFSQDSIEVSNSAGNHHYAKNHPCKYALFENVQIGHNETTGLHIYQHSSLQFNHLSIKQQRLELLLWESALAWAGAQSPTILNDPEIAESDRVDLRQVLEEFANHSSDIVYLLKHHSESALSWFRKHLEHYVYLDVSLKTDQALEYLFDYLPTIQLPGYLSHDLANKLGIVSRINFDENLDLVLRQFISKIADRPLVGGKRDLFFCHLNKADEETRRLAAENILFQTFKFVNEDCIIVENKKGVANVKHVFVFSDDSISTEHLLALEAARRNGYVEVIKAEYEQEKLFLRMNASVFDGEMTSASVVKAIVTRHTEQIGKLEGLDSSEVIEIQDEILFLFKHKDIALEFLKLRAGTLSHNEPQDIFHHLWVPVGHGKKFKLCSPASKIALCTILTESCVFKKYDDVAAFYHKDKLTWEKALLWIGCRLDETASLCIHLNFLLEGISWADRVTEFSELIFLHSSSALQLFKNQMKQKIYLNKELRSSSDIEFCSDLIDGLFITIPDGLDKRAASLIAIYSELDQEVINEVLRELFHPQPSSLNREMRMRSREQPSSLDRAMRMWSSLKWEIFFKHLHRAPIEIVDLVRYRRIYFNLLPQCRWFIKEKFITYLVPEGFDQSNGFKLVVHSLQISKFKSKKQSWSEIVLIGAKSDAEYCFLRRCMEWYDQPKAVMDTDTCIRILVERRLEIQSEEEEDDYWIKKELLYLHKHCEKTLETLRSIINIDSHHSTDNELLQKLNYSMLSENLSYLRSHGRTDLKRALQWLGKDWFIGGIPKFKSYLPDQFSTMTSKFNQDKIYIKNHCNSKQRLDGGCPGLEAEDLEYISESAEDVEYKTADNELHYSDCQDAGKDIREGEDFCDEVQTVSLEGGDELFSSLDTSTKTVVSENKPVVSGLNSRFDNMQTLINQERRLLVGKWSEQYIFELISRMAERKNKKITAECWVSSFSAEYRKAQGISERGINDGLGYDFVVDSNIVFGDVTNKKAKCLLEVKGTESSNPLSFFISLNQLFTMQNHREDCEYIVVLVADVSYHEKLGPTGNPLGYLDCSNFLSDQVKYDLVIKPSRELELIPKEYMVTLESHAALAKWPGQTE